MKKRKQQGLTLAELIIAVAIIGLLTAAAASLLSAALASHDYADHRSSVVREAVFAMERITSGLRKSTFVLFPNAHDTTRTSIAFSGLINEDSDSYFGDALFPRIDEDLAGDMTNDGQPGLATYDDDGDGTADNGASASDDDEDGANDDEVLDGLDNDSDGNVDEDLAVDASADGRPGWLWMDDDGDGTVDDSDSSVADDDEDGADDEDGLNPTVYAYDSVSTLTESQYQAGGGVVARALSTSVTAFSATYEAADATHGPRYRITLTLTDANGKSLTLDEFVYPRNTVQKSGKRVS